MYFCPNVSTMHHLTVRLRPRLHFHVIFRAMTAYKGSFEEEEEGNRSMAVKGSRHSGEL